ncbi:MAG: SHOCT domain-containing protein [Actinomycetota bacterium]|nr:SHOCT domain-containing protein [Actinomycetota bacterium]
MPLFDLFWSMLWFFLWVAWIWAVIAVVSDIFRNRDLGGFAKAIWLVFVILIPWLGVLIYLIANGDDMAQRNVARSQERDQATRAYIQQASGSGTSTAAELKGLNELRTAGVLSDDEFNAQKAKLLT